MELPIGLEEKYKNLVRTFSDMKSVLICFSGGVDSLLLLKAAKDGAGDGAAAVTVVSEVIPEMDLRDASDICNEFEIKHYVISEEVLKIKGFTTNPPDRCYICKKEIFSKVVKLATDEGYDYIAEGSNFDDLNDFRPGMRAVSELGIKSPLKECGLTKNEIRLLLKWFGIKIWNKPSCACLASRFTYGEKITPEKLQIVARAEKMLYENGFFQNRVRVQGRTARIEVPVGEFPKLMEKEVREKLAGELKRMGFSYVTLDLSGYRSGSMNETLLKKE